MRLLTVAAHPDDETLGAGGTMAWHAARGDTVWALVMADGASSRHGRVAQQAECARRAADVLGIDRLILLGLPDQRLDTLPMLDLVTPIEEVVAELEPDVVLTHFPGDLNEDHRLVARAATVAARAVPGTPVSKMCAFEVPSSTDWAPPIPGSVFAPNLYVDVSETLETKLTAMKAYAQTFLSEVRPFPHPRSLEALTAAARRHGAASGLLAAEPFMLLRESATYGMRGVAAGDRS
jgi:LmbE family N-acetylglucosaminyl deacetylase